MARRFGKIDSVQTKVVATAREMGASVYSLADVGKGMPDLVIGIFGITELWEVKTEKGKLTTDQVKFHATFKGGVQIIRSDAEAIRRIQELGQMGRIGR